MANLSKLLLAGAVPIGTPGLSHFDRLLGQALGGRETEKTATPGPVVTFETNLAKGLTSLKVLITAQQSGSGDPSPTNIRPITGWTGCTISHSNGVDTPTQYTIAFPAQAGTVYGGTLDVVAGTLTVDRIMRTYSVAEYYGIYGPENAPLYYFVIAEQDVGVIMRALSTADPALTSNIFAYTTGDSASRLQNNALRTGSGQTPDRFYFRADDFADLTALNAFLSGTPCVIVAWLRIAQTYTLTPTEIETLIGQNVVFADTGDIAELKYLVKE